MLHTAKHQLSANPSRQELLDLWRCCITSDSAIDPHDAVVVELSVYFDMPLDQVVYRCLHWERDSLKEWQAGDRSTPEGLLDFYQTQTSWIFDTMWYHANQCIDKAPAETVEIMYGLRHLKPGAHLDFGAGPGTSSIFMYELGWEVSLADISITFQDFARWRLQKHDVSATFYNTSEENLPSETFDLITAFDVMVHVPNITATLAQLHRALKSGGYLVFNIDNLPCTPLTVWNLYEDQYPILSQVRRVGFRRHPKITYFHVYQKVKRTTLRATGVRLYDTLRYNQYVSAIGNQVRAIHRSIKKK